MKPLRSQKILDIPFFSNPHLVVVEEGFVWPRMKTNYGRNTKWPPPNQRQHLGRLPCMLKNASRESATLSISLFAIHMATAGTFSNVNVPFREGTRSSLKCLLLPF